MKASASMLRILFALNVFVLFACMFHEVPLAEEPGAELRIGTQLLPPYGQIDSQGKASGVIYALNEEIGKRSGMDYTHEVLPFSRILHMVDLGALDVFSSQPHDTSLKVADKLALQFLINVVVVSKKSSGIETLEDFKGKNVVYHTRASYPILHDIPQEIFYVEGYESMLKMLKYREEIHGAVFSEPAYYFFLDKLHFSQKDFGSVLTVYADREQWILVKKSMPQDLRNKLKKIVDEIFEEKMYDRLLDEIKMKSR